MTMDSKEGGVLRLMSSEVRHLFHQQHLCDVHPNPTSLMQFFKTFPTVGNRPHRALLFNTRRMIIYCTSPKLLQHRQLLPSMRYGYFVLYLYLPSRTLRYCGITTFESYRNVPTCRYSGMKKFKNEGHVASVERCHAHSNGGILWLLGIEESVAVEGWPPRCLEGRE